MTEVRIPKLNSNDSVYTLIEWLVGDNQPVEAGEPIATLETSKAVEDFVCTESGVLWQHAPAGAQCAPGELIARVVPTGTPRDAVAEPDPRPTESTDRPVITAPACALMNELGIPADQVRGLGLPLVRRSDIEKLMTGERETPESKHTLSPAQRAVASTVRRSHQTIPSAYTVVRVEVGRAQEQAARLGVQLRTAVGLPELLIAAVAPLYTEFPLCFAEPLDDETARLPDDAHVGVTIDTGEGLFVPVVKGASGLKVGEIAHILRGFRRAASHNAFRAEELVGGNIMISLNHEPGIVAAVPIVFPGQTCAISLTSARTELQLDPVSAVVACTITDIGLAYDHRFVNGREAVSFLQRIKHALESVNFT